jgi:hypothetical protein
MHGKEELAPGLADMSWFDQDGHPISEEAWNNPEERIIVLRRAERNDDGAISAVTLLLNPTIESRTFKLPAPHVSTRMLIDTDKPDVSERDLEGHVPAEDVQQRALAHARRADHRDHLALGDGQVEIVQHVQPAARGRVGLCQTSHLDQRHVYWFLRASAGSMRAACRDG